MQRRLNKLQQWLQGQVQTHVYYYSDQLYKVAKAQLQPVKNSNTSAKVVVVARHCYEEVVHTYPITKKNDVLKRVQLEQEDDRFIAFSIGDVVNGKTTVTYFRFVNDDVINNAWLVVPESLLLSNALDNGEVVAYTPPTSVAEPPVFLAKTNQGVISMLSGGMLKTIEHFAHAQGLRLEQSSNWDQRETERQLIDRAGTLLQFLQRGFVNKAAIKQTAKKWRLIKIAAVSIAAITLYLLIVNQVLSVYVQSRQDTLSAQNKEARTVLAVQNDIDQMTQRFSTRMEQVQPGRDPVAVWQVLAPLMGESLTVTQVEWDNDEYRVRLDAVSATDALQQLLNNDRVARAEFLTAVRRQRNRDVVTISLTLKAGVDNG